MRQAFARPPRTAVTLDHAEAPMPNPRSFPSITLDPDSWTCPTCGHILVPSDDRGGRPADSHSCAGDLRVVRDDGRVAR